ncbi:MAG: DUF4178 domain-containing protein [Bacteroidota bacterium]
MFEREFECPSCGAPVKQTTPGARSLICSYCGQTSHVNADSIEAVGEKNLLIDYGSVLGIGKYGRFREREFIILGRIRIDYDDGFWDEWYVQFLDDGTEGWIQEDDGSFTMYHKRRSITTQLSLAHAPVGQYADLLQNGQEIFVTHKSKARVNGGEGELPFPIIPGEVADFVDGIWDGNVVSIEYLPGENSIYLGEIVELDELGLSS